LLSSSSLISLIFLSFSFSSNFLTWAHIDACVSDLFCSFSILDYCGITCDNFLFCASTFIFLIYRENDSMVFSCS
jgi:hypothetical protein